MLDLRYALRQLGRQPAFTLAAVLTLSLGVGATTAIFSLLQGIVLRPLPYPEPERLVRIWEVNPRSGDFSTSEPTFLDWVAQSTSFSDLAAYQAQWLNVEDSGEPQRLAGAAVSASLFSLLRAEAALGRTFDPSEDLPEAGESVVVLGHGLWRDVFGEDPEILGRRLSLQGRPHTVIGVMPEGYSFPHGTHLWIPLEADPESDRGEHWLTTVGRLAPGVSLERASLEMARISHGLGELHPENKGWGARVESFKTWLVGERATRRVLALAGAVGLLLLLACANVASLLVARASTRRHEMGVRSSLGAGGGRLMRQMLTECSLLALLGAAGGLLLASWMVPWLVQLESGLPRAGEVGLDLWTLTFTLAVSFATLLLFGPAAAREAVRRSPGVFLEGGSRVARGVGGRLRATLVGIQVGLALVVAIGAGLLLRSLLALGAVDPGFDSERVLTIPLELPWEQFSGEERWLLASELERRLEALPGVERVGASASNPLVSWGFSVDVTPEERAAEVGDGGFLQVGWRAVSPGFFTSLRIPLITGRSFDDKDLAAGEKIALVSRSLAEALWPGSEVMGQRLFMGGTEGRPYTVVGVVGDLRDRALSERPQPILYIPYERAPMSSLTLFVRHGGAPDGLASLLRREVRAAAPGVPITEISPLAGNLAASLDVPRFQTLLFLLFAGLSLFLAAVGIYGLISFSVGARQREIGIQRSLGASPRLILRQLLAESLRPLGLGLAWGLLVAWVGSRLLGDQLYEVKPWDLWAYLGAVAVLGLVAAFAVLMPARKALEVDPRQLFLGD